MARGNHFQNLLYFCTIVPMKIVFNTDQIYLHGGIEKVMATKANYFANLPDTSVYIVTTEQDGKAACYPLDPRVKLIDLGVDYIRSRTYFSIANLKKAFKHYRKQKQLFGELKPDVIISPNYNFDHYWLPFIKGQAKLIKERHSSAYDERQQRENAGFLKGFRYKLMDWIGSKYDHIVVLNPDEAGYLHSDNAVVIPNPVALSNLTAQLENPRVIAAGRISPVKNFGDLITAWAEVVKTYPEWQLHFYGQDYLGTQAGLEQKVKELDLEKQVYFRGSVQDIPQTMTDYSLYAMTSETECFPMVLLEALSVGLPVVSYDCPNGPRNIVTNQVDGLLTKYMDVQDFAENVKLLINDTVLRKQMGANAKRNVERFSTEAVMEKWERLLGCR